MRGERERWSERRERRIGEGREDRGRGGGRREGEGE